MTLLLLSSLASAGDFELAADVTRFEFADGNQALFGVYGAVPTYGLQGTWHKSSRLAITAGWSHTVDGAFNAWSEWEYDVESSNVPGQYEGFHTSLRANFASVGVRGGVDLWSWFNPYATAEVRGMLGTLRLDDDVSDDDNPNQITLRSGTIGGLAAAGLDIRIPTSQGWSVSHNLEVGYQAMLPLGFDTLGDVAIRGVHVRAGLGVRW